MSIEKLLPDFIKNLFVAKEDLSSKDFSKDLFRQCPQCKKMIYNKKISPFYICNECGYHFQIDNLSWIRLLFDKNSFSEFFANYISADPLKFPKYKEKISTLHGQGESTAITVGKAKINNIEVFAGIMNSKFMMGSMGSVVGEKITLLFEQATLESKPVILIVRSGGARMQEGVISLMQMTKTASIIKRFSLHNNLYIPVLTHPTTGGISASFAMLGDITIAEPKALIGFAGPRVIEQTIKQKLPDNFQSAEFNQEKGFIDSIVKRNNLKEYIYKILKIHNF